MFELKDVKYMHILDIQHLYLKQSKVTCIVGESGSGKSTLLRLLNKLISCDSGEVLYKNQPLEAIDSVELRRKVVMLPQQPAIFPGTVRDNLLLGLKFAERPMVSDDQLCQALERVRLSKALHHDSDKLSGGEKQRLALARVILLDPEVYLLDEPSSALDEETEQIIIEKLVAHTKETNRTLIMVTHSKKVAQAYAENVVEVSQGKVVSFREVSANERCH